ncbi:glycosyltransferase [Pseudonocardia phyllosphaerae]|uniref:glycosyltransferase n=1 Tax=Pseudonocardia phyllosphaerae TaxID=3390502 RepID=UPI00397D7031
MLTQHDTPVLSVCIPVYQGAEHLERTLHSVLEQEVRTPDGGMEVVVRDNASTDGSADVVASFDDPRIRLERATETVPMAENWTRTIELARGEFVKIVCADDVVAPGSLAEQVERLRADPHLALAVGRTDMVDDTDRVLFAGRHLPRSILGTCDANDVLRTVVRHGGNPIGPPAAAMFRRADFDAIGGLDPELLFTMDLDLWVRLLRHGNLHGDRRTAAGFRIHPGSASAATSKEQFATQREFTRRLVASPYASIRKRDRAIGTVGSYAALARRYGLFVYGTLRRPADASA